MFKSKIILLVSFFLISSAFIFAQDNPVDKMMSNNQTRNQAMDYILNHHDYMLEFMNKMMSDKDVWNSMMGYMMDNNNSRMSMMDHMFSKADKDKLFYNEMQQFMNNHGEYMNMMQGMMGNNMHGGMMHHSGMMNNNQYH